MVQLIFVFLLAPDMTRPPSALVPKRPAAATSVAKKTEPPKPVTTVKLSSASKWPATAKASEKTQQAVKPPPKKPAAAAKFPPLNKPAFGRTPPASPANKPANGTPQPKRGTKPTQAVLPFTAVKKTGVSATPSPAVDAQSPVAAAAANVPSEPPSPPPSPGRTASPQTSPPQVQLQSTAPSLTVQEPICVPAEQTLPHVASPPCVSNEPVLLSTDQTPSTSKSLQTTLNVGLQAAPPTNLNEEEDEEEREASQLVSVSEMSGTTQPTEESRPESAGLVGGSAWRAGGALLSELDSEDVSGSQQGASELSAPGVLEGTESMDDLGDGSLKGAIDMEGASAGSPDFEKVPDIPANDFDEDEEDDDDNDRVCDMDVGSEQTDEPQRTRHDNDVEEEEEEEEDNDVEMASEGVTESGLESYGNADEDDFAEDERLDNLNRVVQPPPPPPLLPSAPAAQWDQPNPFADPWAEPVQHQQDPEQIFPKTCENMAGATAASPDSETPAQLELGLTPCASENQEISHASKGLEGQLSSPAPMKTLPAGLLSAPGRSLSSTLSSETSSPEELGEPNRAERLQHQEAHSPVLSPQPDLVCQNLDTPLEIDVGQNEEEAETLPADEVLEGPATAPTSNPSSTSITEDEASDTEGEAQLEDSLEGSAAGHNNFDCQAPALRCLSTVEEGEEVEDAERGVGDDTTPPSATSLASYGFDSMTTASNSHAQSTGESCIKSPGIFSLEELPEEAKEPCFVAQPCLAEQQYIECGKQEGGSAEHVKEEEPGSDKVLDPVPAPGTLPQQEDIPDEIQPPYYSAICENTESFYAGNV